MKPKGKAEETEVDNAKPTKASWLAYRYPGDLTFPTWYLLFSSPQECSPTPINLMDGPSGETTCNA